MPAIPSSRRPAWLTNEINTTEQELLRMLYLHHWLYGNAEFPANVDDRQAKRIVHSPGTAFDNKPYGVWTVAIEYDLEIITLNPNNKKPWMAAKEFGNLTSVPDEFWLESPGVV